LPCTSFIGTFYDLFDRIAIDGKGCEPSAYGHTISPIGHLLRIKYISFLSAFAFVLGITLGDSLMVILLVFHLHAQQGLQSPFNVVDRTVIASGILDGSGPDNLRE
jgi:hypothetical protein